MENSREQMIAGLREAVEKMKESLALMERELAFLEGDKSAFLDQEFDLSLDVPEAVEVEIPGEEADIPAAVGTDIPEEVFPEEYETPEEEEDNNPDGNLFGLFASTYNDEQPVGAPAWEASEPAPEPESEQASLMEQETKPLPEPLIEPEPAMVKPAVQDSPAVPENINEMEAAHRKPSLMDLMEEKLAWRVDMPGSPVHNILSAVSLNDRVMFINTLFGGDPIRFQETVAYFNSLEFFDDAFAYVKEHFPDWDLESGNVYRFMMAVRRKLR